jgi:hypothetical protein
VCVFAWHEAHHGWRVLAPEAITVGYVVSHTLRDSALAQRGSLPGQGWKLLQFGVAYIQSLGL